MQQLSKNLYVETGIRGCNHGFVTTSDGVVMIDSPHKPSDAMKLKAEIAKHGPLRYIINTEPHGDHWTGNAYFDVPVIAHEGVRRRILETDLKEHVARVATFGPEEPKLLEGYKPNAPIITFKNGMTLHVGNHTFQMIHMPGHTAYQAAICIKEEGAVFTSDNIFHKCHTWLQEANPDLWLLEAYVKRAIDRGMTKDEAIEKLTGMTDRYPMDVGQDGMAPSVMKRNVANLYDYLTGDWKPL
jgi:glyoxylase-like metal-dependent hydrolase (beta-lactamase superfamily II)